MMRQCGLLLLLVACAHNVPQDRATGPDGKQKGAKAITFENGEAKVKDIVTYPGGDRVDWKLIEIPDGHVGQLDLQLSWKTPRPGLQVAFDVFDQWNHQVAHAAYKKGGPRVRSAKLDVRGGKYFVRVYAPKRGDAGQYTLVATYQEIKAPQPVDIEVPEPPRLPAIPDVEPTCDVFDAANKACAKECPHDAPDGWKGCTDRDTKKAAEEARKAAEAARQACLKDAPKPLIVQIKHVELAGDVAKVKLGVGTSKLDKLDTTWTGEVLIGQSNQPLTGGSARILGVDKQVTRAEIRLTIDQLNANPRVRLTPPATVCP